MRMLSVVLTTLFLVPGLVFAGRLHKAGQCVIKEKKGSFSRETGVLTLTLKNDDIQASCRIYSGMLNDRYSLFAIPTIKNFTDKNLDVQYYASFYDMEGNLVASITHSPLPTQIAAKCTGYQLGSSVTELPRSEIKKIKSCQITLYTLKSEKKAPLNSPADLGDMGDRK